VSGKMAGRGLRPNMKKRARRQVSKGELRELNGLIELIFVTYFLFES